MGYYKRIKVNGEWKYVEIPYKHDKLLNILNRKDLQALAKRLGVRPDWHEPDEQDVTITFVGSRFDNAMCDESEKSIIIKKRGIPVAIVNAAILLAMACGTYEGIE